jgi:hypothetical protein
LLSVVQALHAHTYSSLTNIFIGTIESIHNFKKPTVVMRNKEYRFGTSTDDTPTECIKLHILGNTLISSQIANTDNDEINNSGVMRHHSSESSEVMPMAGRRRLSAGSDITPGLSAKGKSAQDIFKECILRKNKGDKFVSRAGTDVFHTEEELREFLTRAAGDAVAHIDYAPIAPETQAAWLVNMPSDEAANWGAGANDETIRREVEDACLASGLPPPPSPPAPSGSSLAATIVEADRAVSSWKNVKNNVTVHLRDGGVARQTNPDSSLVSLPNQKADRPAREGLQCHGSAGTPLRTHAGTEALGLQDTRATIRT